MLDSISCWSDLTTITNKIDPCLHIFKIDRQDLTCEYLYCSFWSSHYMIDGLLLEISLIIKSGRRNVEEESTCS